MSPQPQRRFLLAMFLRFFITLLSIGSLCYLQAQEHTLLRPEEADIQKWFNDANRVYDYAKTESDPNKRNRAFQACIPLFTKFVNTAPQDVNAAKAMYRAAVSYLLIGYRREAEAGFLTTLTMTQKRGQIAAAAAFRLGALAYNDEAFDTALPHFALTSSQATKPQLRQKALNYEARCLLLTKKTPQAEKVLRRLVNDPNEPNQFKHQAQLALSHIAATSGKLDEAYESYLELAALETEESSLLQIKAQAIVHGGMTAMRLGKDQEGLSMLRTALTTPGLPQESKAEAQLTLMQHEYAKERYQEVQDLFRIGRFNATRQQTTAEILLYAGKASARLEQHHIAVELFINAVRTYPESKIAFEASYLRLSSFYALNNISLPSLIDVFVAEYAPQYPKSPRIQMARLMKAETFFNFSNFGEATLTWEEVNFSRLPKEQRGPALFKSGWALVENGDNNSAIGILSEFIARYSESEHLYTALAKRAESYLVVGDRLSALADCERILEAKPDKALTSFALQLSARIQSEEGQNDKMLASYQTLLSSYKNLSQDTIARTNYQMGVGYFRNEEFETALKHLNKARSLVPEFYELSAGKMAAFCYYRLQKEEELERTVARLYIINPKIALPRRLLVWLGLKMYEKSNFSAANRYLSQVFQSDEAGTTETGILKALAKARLAIPGQASKSLLVIDKILATEDEPFWRCDALLDKTNCLIMMRKWNEAEIAAHRGLSLDAQGSIEAGLHLALGDISLARADYGQAASAYVRASEFYLNDATIQPLALHKAALCLRQSGDLAAAAAFEKRLKSTHPNWKKPKSLNITPGSALQPSPQETPVLPLPGSANLYPSSSPNSSSAELPS